MILRVREIEDPLPQEAGTYDDKMSFEFSLDTGNHCAVTFARRTIREKPEHSRLSVVYAWRRPATDAEYQELRGFVQKLFGQQPMNLVKGGSKEEVMAVRDHFLSGRKAN